MDRILKPYIAYTCTFINNIIIFSDNLKDYLKYLKVVFSLFVKMNIALALAKAFIGYPSIKLLSSKVNSLGLINTAQRI
jgi:hypothetical protein